ncbi:MAG: hypothetical protein GX239_05980, partial [Clostridiaceae bacterium]|nr:hypothetical protein [Clostridiaceae bacterium]
MLTILRKIMSALHSLFKRKTFRTILISYIIVMLIPVIISIAVYSTAVSTINRQLSDIGWMSVVQLKTESDAAISKVMDSAKALAFDPVLRSLIDESDNPDPAVLYNINKLSDTLRSLEVSDSQVLHAYIYFSKDNSILSGDYRYSSRNVEKFSLDEFGLNIQDLRGSINHNPGGTVTLNKDGSRLLIIRPVLSPNDFSFSGAVIMTIDPVGLISMLKNLVFESGASFMIVPDKEIYISEKGSGAIEWKDNLKDQLISDLIGYEVYTALCPSSVGQFTYATSIDIEEYYRPIQNITGFMTAYILLCLTIGLIIAFFAAKKRYTPIERMLKFVSTKHDSSEFQAIEQALRNADEMKKCYDRMQAEQGEIAKENVLVGILKGKPFDPEYLESVLALHKIDLSGDGFAVAVLQVDDYSNLFGGEEAISEEESIKLTKIILRSIVTEMLSPIA